MKLLYTGLSSSAATAATMYACPAVDVPVANVPAIDMYRLHLDLHLAKQSQDDDDDGDTLGCNCTLLYDVTVHWDAHCLVEFIVIGSSCKTGFYNNWVMISYPV